MAGFIFGGDTGMSYEALQRKRKITDALMQQKNKPMDVANGLAQGLSSVAGALMNKKLDKREDQMRSDRQGEFTDLFGGGVGSGGGAPAMSQNEALAAHGGPTNAAAAATGAPIDLASFEQKYELPSGYLSRTAQIESNMGRNMDNPNSSAGGPFQFIDSTAKQYGLQDKYDWTQSADAASRLARDNAAVLSKALGRAPTGAELYLAHQQGAGGAAKMLSNPNARAVDIVGADAVRLNGGDVNMTAGEFASKWTGKFGGSGGQPSQTGGGQSRSPADLAQLAQFAADPLLDPAQRKIAEIMLQREMQQGDPASVQEYEYAKQNGYQGGYQDWVTQKAQSGATNISNVVNSGDPIDARPMADKPDKGYQRRWDDEQKTWVDEAIPGSSSQVDIATQDAKKAERERQKAIGLGPTLTNIQMNIDEIQDGGLPVTGAVGAGLGKIPGTAASDWRVRNEQITTEAALNEVQNMRDNSPTGGAVGQLTDSERQALAVAASGLSDAQSKDEYVRAAQTYRKTMLDLAYGQGSWTLDEKGNLSFGGAEPAAPPAADVDFSSDAAPQGLKLSESDADLWKYATPEERQAMWGK